MTCHCIKTKSGGVLVGGNAFADVANDVWSQYLAALPLQEDYDDRSRQDLDGTGGEVEPTPDTGTFCGYGLKFDAQERSYFTLPAHSLERADGFGFSFWIKPQADLREMTIYDGIGRLYVNAFSEVGLDLPGTTNTGSEDLQVFEGTTSLALDTWYHVAFSVDKTQVKCYLNGALKFTKSLTLTPYKTTDGADVGRSKNGSQYLSATLQDFRIHLLARDANYFAAEYANYCSEDFYLTLETGDTY